MTKAQKNLTAQAFEFYSPRLMGEFGRPENMFPSYLLVKHTDNWPSVNYTRGIAKVMMEGSKPGLIDDGLIVNWKALEGEDGLIRLPRPLTPPKFYPRQRLRLMNDAMSGSRGSTVIYQHHTSEERCAVLLRFLGKQITVTVREDDLVAI